MTEPLFFDSDCLSAFLWVNEQSILNLIYPGRIIIPKAVYDELSYPTTPHLKDCIDYLIAKKQATIENILIPSAAFKLYDKLTKHPDKGHKIIGSGEAACIALATTQGDIIASNNLKDIKAYTSEFGLEYITTGDILLKALDLGYISEEEGNNIWYSMLNKRRQLGATSFSEYIKSKNNL